MIKINNLKALLGNKIFVSVLTGLFFFTPVMTSDAMLPRSLARKVSQPCQQFLNEFQSKKIKTVSYAVPPKSAGNQQATQVLTPIKLNKVNLSLSSSSPRLPLETRDSLAGSSSTLMIGVKNLSLEENTKALVPLSKNSSGPSVGEFQPPSSSFGKLLADRGEVKRSFEKNKSKMTPVKRFALVTVMEHNEKEEKTPADKPQKERDSADSVLQAENSFLALSRGQLTDDGESEAPLAPFIMRFYEVESNPRVEAEKNLAMIAFNKTRVQLNFRKIDSESTKVWRSFLTTPTSEAGSTDLIPFGTKEGIKNLPASLDPNLSSTSSNPQADRFQDEIMQGGLKNLFKKFDISQTLDVDVWSRMHAARLSEYYETLQTEGSVDLKGFRDNLNQVVGTELLESAHQAFRLSLLEVENELAAFILTKQEKLFLMD